MYSVDLEADALQWNLGSDYLGFYELLEVGNDSWTLQFPGRYFIKSS